jgi:hypothetical protein
MIASSLLQNSRNSPSARESTNIPTIAQDFFESFGFPAYPLNNALGVTSDKILLRGISTTLEKLVFNLFTQSKDFSKHLSLDSQSSSIFFSSLVFHHSLIS